MRGRIYCVQGTLWTNWSSVLILLKYWMLEIIGFNEVDIHSFIHFENGSSTFFVQLISVTRLSQYSESDN